MFIYSRSQWQASRNLYKSDVKIVLKWNPANYDVAVNLSCLDESCM